MKYFINHYTKNPLTTFGEAALITPRFINACPFPVKYFLLSLKPCH